MLRGTMSEEAPCLERRCLLSVDTDTNRARRPGATELIREQAAEEEEEVEEQEEEEEDDRPLTPH